MACDSDVAGMDVCSEEVANALQDFKELMVFVGGAVVSLYTNDPAADEIRPTHDIEQSQKFRKGMNNSRPVEGNLLTRPGYTNISDIFVS